MIMSAQPQLWQTKTFWSLFKAKKNIIDADSDKEIKMNNAAPVPTSSEMWKIRRSRICLQHHDSWNRVWRHRGERMLNSCVMHHHTGPEPGIMVWDGIGYHSRTLLVRITGTLNSQRYISEVLEPVVLPYLQGLATAIF
ncbi:transposable element Tcb1 transposase [Trichonephila clavipes]|nr:transposable element Tcb1 transposase [Trichonephila clavipes]